MTTDTVQTVAPAPEVSPRQRWARFALDRGVYVALAVLVLYNLVATPHFASFTTTTLLMKQTSAVLIVALGMLLVIGTGGIDLSVGATMAISAAVLGRLLGHGDAHVWTAVAVALLAGLAVGLFNGLVVGVFGVPPIVATLSLLVGGRGLALYITSGQLVELFSPELRKIGIGFVPLGGDGQLPYLFLIALGLAVIVAVVIRTTTLGFRIVVIGGNGRAALLAGLPVRKTLLSVYAISGVLAAVAGVLATARLRSADPSYLGLNIELQAITAVVVGGTLLTGGRMRLLGTVAGVLLMQLLTTTLTAHNIPSSQTQMVIAVIIVLAVYLQRNTGSTS